MGVILIAGEDTGVGSILIAGAGPGAILIAGAGPGAILIAGAGPGPGAGASISSGCITRRSRKFDRLLYVKLRMSQAIRTPMKILKTDSIYLCQGIFPGLTLSMGRSRLGEIGVCTPDPFRSYMGSPLDGHSV
jgi:hypothetical protein